MQILSSTTSSKLLRSTRALVLAALAVLCLFVETASAAPIRGRAIAAQLGVRFEQPLTDTVKPGTTVHAIVVNLEKFKARGFDNATAGDRISLKLVEEKRLTVTHVAASKISKTRAFTFNADGVLQAAE